MIDLNTGEIILAGVKFNALSKVEDFLQYDESIVYVNNRGNGRGIIRLQKYVESNGILAQVKFEINEKTNSRRVVILPSLQNMSSLTLLEASKLWMRGMAVGDYRELPDSIIGEYIWGYVIAQYRQDRDYGTVGGEISIVFGG
jgi:hypothetical protein